MEENIKKININELPKGVKLLFTLFPLLLLVLFLNSTLDNDFYFLYPTGKYIVNNSFPTHDFLSMHSSMEIIVQQWLSSVIFYFTYSKLGLLGIQALLTVAFCIFCLVSFKLFKLVTDNHFVSCFCALIADGVIASYIVSRPQIFTYIILATELYFLEKYVKTGKITSLIAIPISSLLLINMHCSMWVMVLVLMLPYLVASFPVKIKNLELRPCCSFMPLATAFIASIGIAFLNPYGFKAMKYILTSFGYKEINNLILEMKAITLTGTYTGTFFIFSIAFCGALMVINRNKVNVRFWLLFIGLTVFSLLSVKSIPYFYIGALPAFASAVKDFSFDLKIEKKKEDKRTRVILVIALVVVVCFLGYIGYDALSESDNSTNNVTQYDQLDETIKILNKARSNGENIVLYAGFNNGQYLEFNGYHPYIDGRAELFLDDNNHEFNYMMEYYKLKNAGIYYKDFLDKYEFNYLIIGSDELYLKNSISHDNDYVLLYSGEDKTGKKDDNSKESYILMYAKKDKSK